MADKALKDMAPDEAEQALKKIVGQELILIEDFTAQKIVHKAGPTALYKIKAANITGASAGKPTCVVVGQNTERGTIFAPHTFFGFVGVSETAFEETDDGMFTFDGADDTSVLFTLFAQKAPNSDTARELYMIYMSEFGEEDIEAFEAMLESLKLTDVDSWTDANLEDIQALLSKGLDAVSQDQTKLEPGGTPTEGPTPGKRGRKPGSKNKPKTETSAPKETGVILEGIVQDSLVITLVAAVLPLRNKYPDTYRSILEQAADAADAAFEALSAE